MPERGASSKQYISKQSFLFWEVGIVYKNDGKTWPIATLELQATWVALILAILLKRRPPNGEPHIRAYKPTQRRRRQLRIAKKYWGEVGGKTVAVDSREAEDKEKPRVEAEMDNGGHKGSGKDSQLICFKYTYRVNIINKKLHRCNFSTST